MTGDEFSTRSQPPSPGDSVRTPGRPAQVGPYKLRAFLGAGGMGEVHRATDTRLGRDVAIKFVAERFGDRADREARAIAALNHPHICTLYDIGPDYLVMELLEGPTLSARLASGALPVEEVALRGAEIADALAEAHGAGIVHRDLKPGNVMLTQRGVKVLDFGLAKLVNETGHALTHTHAVMGTLSHMAPEQVRGARVTAQADLFALGIVLYEMAVGKLPFPGASLGNMLVSDSSLTIPSPSSLRAGLPKAFDRLVLRLLAADPAGRPSSAATVRDELRALVTVPRGATPRRAMVLAAMLGVVATAAGVWWVRSATPPDPLGGVIAVEPVTTFPGREEDPSLAPDGSRVVFSATIDDEHNRDLYVMTLGATNAARLTRDPQDDLFPAWSPDGRLIAFVRRPPGSVTTGEIHVVPVLGGTERSVAKIVLSAEIRNPRPVLSWAPDSREIVFPSLAPETGQWTLSRVNVQEGVIRPLFPPIARDLGDAGPAISGDGRFVAFNRCHDLVRCSLLVQRLGNGWQLQGEPTLVTGTASQLPTAATWLPPRGGAAARLLFLDGVRVMSWRPGAEASLVHASDAPFRSLAAAVSEQAVPRILAARSRSDSDIWVLPLKAGGLSADGPPTVLIRSTANDSSPRYSGDGRHLAFTSTRSGSAEVWLADADGANPRQMTTLGALITGYPHWSPDSTQLVFHARVPDVSQLYVLNATESSPRTPERITGQPQGFAVPSWSADGEGVFASGGGLSGIYRMRQDGSQLERLFEGTDPVATPDGRRLLYQKLSRDGIFARDLRGDPASNAEDRLVEDAPPPPVGKPFPVPGGFYYVSVTSEGVPRAFRFFDDATKRSVDVSPVPMSGGVISVTVSPDRKSLAFAYTSIESDLVQLRTAAAR